MKKLIWAFWLLVTLSIAGYFVYMMWFGEDKTSLLIGETTYGHYQIEMSCETCHSDPFGGQEVLQNACTQCHGDELEMVNDSHPKSKFTDPRNADLLKIVDARYCVSCHTEHHKDKTLEMGLTLPKDYCFHCHSEIAEERESHQGMAFDSCANAGCHNYHDNLALYEGFLLRHADEPVFKAIAAIPALTAATSYQQENPEAKALSVADIDLEQVAEKLTDDIAHQWLQSAHGQNGIACVDCHTNSEDKLSWIDKPNHQQCQSCHKGQVASFLEGKHGMRLAVDKSLPAISPGESEMPFKEAAFANKHSCTACHGAHEFDTQKAAVESCLSCHDDEHSLAYLESPHGALWQQELAGEAEVNTGVSCATCHMPRLASGKNNATVVASHNQNLTLRPNEKMIRPVCMNCHGLAFAIDALADESLIKNNFNGQPVEHIPSIDMAVERENN